MEIFKEEPIEFKDLQETECILIKKESIEETSVGCDNDGKVEDEENIKDEVNPLQSDSDFSLNDKKRRKINMKNIDTSHSEGLIKAKKKKRVRTKELTSKVKLKSKTRKLQTEKLMDTSDKSNLDLSEQFIYFILEKVDELCENIMHGDPDVERSIKVNWDLNNAVNCYRSALHHEEQILIESDTKYNIGVEIDNISIAKDDMGVEIDSNCDVKDDKILEICNNYNAKDDMGVEIDNNCEKKDSAFDSNNSKKFKVPEKQNKKMQEKMNRKIIDDKIELVKKQCGKHTVTSMAEMLNIAKTTLRLRIKKEGIVFSETLTDCEFCEMKKSIQEFETDLLFPFMRFNSENDKFECSICNYLVPEICRKAKIPENSMDMPIKQDPSICVERSYLFQHIRSEHKNEINASKDTKLKQINDCGNFVCQKLYGKKTKAIQNFWCKKCIKELQLKKDNEIRIPKKIEVCSECGVKVQNMNQHLKNTHYAVKQICTYCSHEFSNEKNLKAHIKEVHEKIPCSQCGKQFGKGTKMKRHIEQGNLLRVIGNKTLRK